MSPSSSTVRRRGGIVVQEMGGSPADTQAAVGAFLAEHDLAQYAEQERNAAGWRFTLENQRALQWAPGHDTTGFVRQLGLDTANPHDLAQEILLAMLAAPVDFLFPSADELISAVRIRRNVAIAARRTALAFDTVSAERPQGYWTYAEHTGFTVLPGKSLIDALTLATQPDPSARPYAFSCYRATEYVTLLGLAQELADCNPGLMAELQKQWEHRAIMSGLFHDVFLREYGSMADPLPTKFYVPGDRLWFRNPHEPSADVEGYEGSWVVYLGNGLFTNFWKRDRPFTLTAKCVEIYHWRNAVLRTAGGAPRVDDDLVDELVEKTMADPVDVDRILGIMLRLRDPQGVYEQGGCIDTSRECARWVRPGTSDIALPLAIAENG